MQERKRNALEKLVGVTPHVNLTPKALKMKNGRTRVLP
jgi:hypothetical protein